MATFSFETDNGVLTASAPFYPLAKNSLSPESPAHLSIDEGEDWTFDLTHRVIYESEDALLGVRIDAPPTLERSMEQYMEARSPALLGWLIRTGRTMCNSAIASWGFIRRLCERLARTTVYWLSQPLSGNVFHFFQQYRSAYRSVIDRCECSSDAKTKRLNLQGFIVPPRE